MLIFVSLVFAVIEWIGEHKNIQWLITISKPLVIVFLILWILTTIDFSDSFLHLDGFTLIGFIIALVFCLAGDIFLILPERYFIPGLFSFLLGHIFYIWGFGNLVPKGRNLLPGLVLGAMIVIVTFTVYKRIALGLVKMNKNHMKVPIALYSIIISIMLYAAVLTLFYNKWDFQASFLVSTGGLLFYLSDILNAWIRFVEVSSPRRVMVMMTYHVAQMMLAAGAVFHLKTVMSA
jgi:uncharacterized membrane protein YhhN